MLEVKKTSARHPQSNGQAEAINKTLVKMVWAYLVGEQDEWDQNLGCLAGAYRSTPNESTRLTPNLLAIGREVRLPADVIFGRKDMNAEETPSYACYIEDLKDNLHSAHEVARRYLKNNAKRSKQLYDARQSFYRYEVGDAVWCLNESRKVGVMPKLQKAFEGPNLVKKKQSDLSFVIQMDRQGRERLFHHNKLKPYRGENLPKWIISLAKKL
ncbi:uncharacterized protein LOC128548091 [Mercenaria mercenaria]|uniref:uncharacterized protein LOC128548091 n=1 Tax=Mercenaria mercenaria TaxID=6596 RepID=UPI00234F5DA8|nr:uncharacterized protein LOC128548091 [Mercenaria mercenaria]